MNKKILISIILCFVLILSFNVLSQKVVDDGISLIDDDIKPIISKKPISETYKDINIISQNKEVKLEHINDKKDYKNVYSDKNNLVEVQFNSFEKQGKISEVILKKEYASLKDFSSNEIIKVRMFVGNDNVSYDIYRHSDFNKTKDYVRAYGDIIAYNITSKDGYLEYETNGFSTQVALIPALRFTSIEGRLGGRWTPFSDYYDNKPVKLMSLENNAEYMTNVIFPNDDWDLTTYTIDGVKFELLTDSGDSHLIADVVTPNINYFKDIYIEYVDGDFEFLPLRINNIEIIKKYDIPNFEIGGSRTLTYDLPFFIKKSDYPEYPDGYYYISGIRVWEDDASMSGMGDLMVAKDDISSSGNYVYDGTDYKIELKNDKDFIITSKTSDVTLYFKVYFSNSYYSINEDFSVQINTAYDEPVSSVSTNTYDATNIKFSSATLNADFDTDGESFAYGFAYKEKGTSSWFIKYVGTNEYGMSYTYNVNGLKQDTEYEFKSIILSVSDDYYEGSTKSFTTTTEVINNPPINILNLPNQKS